MHTRRRVPSPPRNGLGQTTEAVHGRRRQSFNLYSVDTCRLEDRSRCALHGLAFLTWCGQCPGAVPVEVEPAPAPRAILRKLPLSRRWPFQTPHPCLDRTRTRNQRTAQQYCVHPCPSIAICSRVPAFPPPAVDPAIAMATHAPADPPPSYDELRSIPAPINATTAAKAAPDASRSPRRPPGPPPLLPLDIPALNQLRHQRVVLASASPRRRQLLGIVSLPLLPRFPAD